MKKREYRKLVNEELSFYNRSIKHRLLRYDEYLMAMYLKNLRWSEWYDSRKGFINKIAKVWFTYHLRKLERVLGFQIGLHTCGLGLKFYHWGTIIVNSDAKIGKNAIMYPGVVIGQTSHNKVPIIGNDCFIGAGAKLFGNIKIGNNVTIAANAVVISDVPDNAVVGGVPAKILKIKNL